MSGDFNISSISNDYPIGLPTPIISRKALPQMSFSIPQNGLEADTVSFGQSSLPPMLPGQPQAFVEGMRINCYNPMNNYNAMAMPFPYMNCFIEPQNFLNATMQDISNFVDLSQMMVGMGSAMNQGYSLTGQFGNYLQMMNAAMSQQFGMPMMQAGNMQQPGYYPGAQQQQSPQNNPMIIDNTGPLDPRAKQVAERINTTVSQTGYQGLKDLFTFGNARSTIKQYITSLSPYMLTEVERSYDTTYGDPGKLRTDIENSTMGRTQSEIKKHLDYALAYNNNYEYVAKVLNNELKGLDWDNSGQTTVERYLTTASPYSILKTQDAYDNLTGHIKGQFRRDIEKDTMGSSEKRLIGKLNEAELFMIGLSQQSVQGQGIPQQGQSMQMPYGQGQIPVNYSGISAQMPYGQGQIPMNVPQTMTPYMTLQDPLLPNFGDPINNIQPKIPLKGDVFDPSLDPAFQIK